METLKTILTYGGMGVVFVGIMTLLVSMVIEDIREHKRLDRAKESKKHS